MSQFLFIAGPHEKLSQLRERFLSGTCKVAPPLHELDANSLDQAWPFLAFIVPNNRAKISAVNVQHASCTPVVALGICHLNNLAELQATLAPSQNRGNSRTFTDIELIVETHARGGGNHDERLRGQFAYVLFNHASGELHAALSAFSNRQLFVYERESIIAISNCAQLLAKVGNQKPSPEPDVMASWLAGQPNPHRSLFQHLQTIPAACHLHSYPGQSFRIRKFWDLDAVARLTFEDARDYESHFHQLLSTEVGGCFARSRGPVCSQMSGGLDSTSITALAAHLVKGQARALHTVSHRYRHTASCDESALIDMMIEHLTPEQAHDIELDSFEHMTFAQLYPTDFNNPGIVHSPKYLQELTLVASLGADLLLTGNGGDETCWGHSSTYTSRLLQGDWAVLPEVSRACRQIHQPLWPVLRHLFVAPLIKRITPNSMLTLAEKIRGRTSPTRSATWLTARGRELLHECETALTHFPNPFSALGEPARHARYHSLHNTSTYNSMRSYQAVADALGITVWHPFLSREVVEFSFAIPEQLLIQKAYPKWLLRRSMAGTLPDAVRWNTHKVVFDQHFARLVSGNADEIRHLLNHPGLADLGLVDNARAVKAFDQVAGTVGSGLNVELLYLILAQSWYQQHCT